jgi:hypothetical protein
MIIGSKFSIKCLELFLLVSCSSFHLANLKDRLQTNAFHLNEGFREGVVIGVELKVAVGFLAY